MKTLLVSSLFISALALMGCVIPLPHQRLHAFGVTGRLLDSQSHSPVKVARIEDSEDQTKATRSGADGSFILPPVYGWHGAYFIGPIGLSLFPALDVPSMSRTIVISAVGYHSVTIPFKDPSTAHSCIQAGSILIKSE